MRHSNTLVIICMIIGLAVLCALGTWQVQRLFWKEALIERVQKRVASQPVDLLQLAGSGFDKEQHEYQPVKLSGEFDHDQEVYFFTTGPGGASGWNVHTPLVLTDGKLVIVNRGFVPFDRKDSKTRVDGQITGVQTLEGLLRFPLAEKPFGSLENSPEKREFYWRNVPAMSEAMGYKDNPFLPVIVDVNEQSESSLLPRGGTTILDFPNNHLQYAITWYGIALTLLGVGSYFLYSRRRPEQAPEK